MPAIQPNRNALWRFAPCDGVEPTNNHAERELCSFVLWREASLGSQSVRGDLFAGNMKSVPALQKAGPDSVLPVNA